MEKIQLSAIEKEMATFNFDELQKQVDNSKSKMKTAINAGDIKTEICSIWTKIGKYIKLLEPVPIVGKYVKILADLLDSICAA